jgi:hypothetical protein
MELVWLLIKWVYNYNTHIKIICNIHGIFEQRTHHNHMSGLSEM